MKILIVAKRPTHPTNSGSRRFILNQINYLCNSGHDIHYLYIHEEWHPQKWGNNATIIEMESRWGDKLHVYRISILKILWLYIIIGLRVLFRHGYQKVDDTYPWFLKRYVNRLNKKYHFDCCIINYYELSRLFKNIDIPLKAITTHDYYAYKTDLIGKRYVKLSTDAHQEAIALKRCPNIFSLNSEESIYFQKLAPNSNVFNVYSIFKFRESKIVGNKNILFLAGSNNYNVNAIDWFIDSIFPTLKMKFPDVILTIGGAICDVLGEIKDDNIILKGQIKDPNSFYDSADVVINPTYQGTGLKIKTLESIAYDKITLTHPHSLTGIFKPEDAPILASENPDDWVSYLNRVWNENGFIERIKEQNKKYINNMNDFIFKEYNRFFSQMNR